MSNRILSNDCIRNITLQQNRTQCYYTLRSSVWTIYIFTIPSHATPRNTIHFNCCVCCLEIYVRLYGSVSAYSFFITPLLLSWFPLESIFWSRCLFSVDSILKTPSKFFSFLVHLEEYFFSRVKIFINMDIPWYSLIFAPCVLVISCWTPI